MAVFLHLSVIPRVSDLVSVVNPSRPLPQVSKKKIGSDAGSDAEGPGRKRKRRIMSDSEGSDAEGGDKGEAEAGSGDEKEGDKAEAAGDDDKEAGEDADKEKASLSSFGNLAGRDGWT